MDRNAIVHELEFVCDPSYVHQNNLVVLEKLLDALGCTLAELSAANQHWNEETISELEHEIREQLLQLVAACMDYLIFTGLSFVSAWEQLIDEQSRFGSHCIPKNDSRLNCEDWYCVLRRGHQAAVRRHRYELAPESGCSPTPDTFFVTMVKLGATAVAVLERSEEALTLRP